MFVSPASALSRRAAGLFVLILTIALVIVSPAHVADHLSARPDQEVARGEVSPTAVQDDARIVATLTPDATNEPAPPNSMATLSPTATGEPMSAAGAIGRQDGVIPDGETLSPFDSDHAAVANLDSELRAAVQQAAMDAEADGIVLVINSGWRSERYQQLLLDDAIVTYGSVEEARRWVNTSEESTHVSGNAVDVGFTDADYWLIENGSRYGLCQTYANEIWHFELAMEPGGTCPTPRDDATAT